MNVGVSSTVFVLVINPWLAKGLLTPVLAYWCYYLFSTNLDENDSGNLLGWLTVAMSVTANGLLTTTTELVIIVITGVNICFGN